MVKQCLIYRYVCVCVYIDSINSIYIQYVMMLGNLNVLTYKKKLKLRNNIWVTLALWVLLSYTRKIFGHYYKMQTCKMKY